MSSQSADYATHKGRSWISRFFMNDLGLLYKMLAIAISYIGGQRSFSEDKNMPDNK